MALFELTDFDRQFYNTVIRDFLPKQVIDIHTHVYLQSQKAPQRDANARAVTWPTMVAKDNSIEDLMETYRLMFPDSHVTPLIFSSCELNDDFDLMNGYIEQCAAAYNVPALLFAPPSWSQSALADRLDAFPYKGIKVYLSLSAPYIPEKEIRIFDFLTHEMLEVLNDRSLAVMLHIPRDGRLKDPVNIAQIQEICHRYPNVKVILAHVGRAYCANDVGNSLQILAKGSDLMFDFTANCNAYVLTELIKAVGPKRVMFGSDLPILRMRMRRIEENGHYVNLVPPGLYGDVSGDPHMRETPGEDFTFFMYREIEAMRTAALATGLNKADIEDIFYANAARLLQLKPSVHCK
jgi:predicted TIM-barrel fold metal-dependent hydrolase